MNNFWDNKNVLVTGGTGFLGSWLCKTLAERGAKVVCLVRDLVPQSYLNLTGTERKVISVFGELEDYFLLERVLNEYEIDTCFHLGAQAIVTVSNRFPISTFESNIRGTWNILEAVRRNAGVKRLVVASSDKAYGSKEKMPYTEDATLEGFNPYDFSKTCTDLMAQMYYKSYGTPIAIARCGNLYGPGDLNFDRLIPGTIKSLIRGEQPLIRSDGTYRRDYFYVEDAVASYLLLGEKLETIKGEAFNFGTETPTTVLEIVDMLVKISGKINLQPKILGIASGEIKVQYLSCEKARTRLQWKFQNSLEDVLENTYQWYEDFLKGRMISNLSV